MFLQAAKTKQRIKEEQMQIKVVERAQQIMVQDQEIVRRERELDATVRKPSEAEKFRLEKLAEANKLVFTFKPLRPEENGHHFANNILKCTFL